MQKGTFMNSIDQPGSSSGLEWRAHSYVCGQPMEASGTTWFTFVRSFIFQKTNLALFS